MPSPVCPDCRSLEPFTCLFDPALASHVCISAWPLIKDFTAHASCFTRPLWHWQNCLWTSHSLSIVIWNHRLIRPLQDNIKMCGHLQCIVEFHTKSCWLVPNIRIVCIQRIHRCPNQYDLDFFIYFFWLFFGLLVLLCSMRGLINKQSW